MIWRTPHNLFFLLALTTSCGPDGTNSRIAKDLAALDRPRHESRRSKGLTGEADATEGEMAEGHHRGSSTDPNSEEASSGAAGNQQGGDSSGHPGVSEGTESIGKSPQAPTVPIDPADPSASSNGPTNGDTVERWLAAVNEVRGSSRLCGTSVMPAVPPLSWNAALNQAAQKHAEDMRANKSLSHTGSDGSSPHDRVVVSGYASAASGENIAFGFVSLKPILTMWLASPGHCANIMNSGFNELGLARSGIYWTMILAKAKD